MAPPIKTMTFVKSQGRRNVLETVDALPGVPANYTVVHSGGFNFFDNEDGTFTITGEPLNDAHVTWLSDQWKGYYLDLYPHSGGTTVIPKNGAYPYYEYPPGFNWKNVEVLSSYTAGPRPRDLYDPTTDFPTIAWGFPGGLPLGNYEYIFTYYSTATELESGFLSAVEYDGVGGWLTVDVSAITLSTGYDSFKVYRKSMDSNGLGNYSKFRYAATITAGPWTWTDNPSVPGYVDPNTAQLYLGQRYFVVRPTSGSNLQYSDLTGTVGTVLNNLVGMPPPYIYEVYIKCSEALKVLPLDCFSSGSDVEFTVDTTGESVRAEIRRVEISNLLDYDIKLSVELQNDLIEPAILGATSDLNFWRIYFCGTTWNSDYVINDPIDSGDVYGPAENNVNWEDHKWKGCKLVVPEAPDPVPYSISDSAVRSVSILSGETIGYKEVSGASITCTSPAIGPYEIHRIDGEPKRTWALKETGLTRTPHLGDQLTATGSVTEPRPYQRYRISDNSVPIRMNIDLQTFTKRVRIYLDGNEIPLYSSASITSLTDATVLYLLTPMTVVVTDENGNETTGLAQGIHNITISLAPYDSEDAYLTMTLSTDIYLDP
jgi:hypothetical protein